MSIYKQKNATFKLALATATSAVVMLSGVTTVNAAELQIAAQQPTIAKEISTDTDGVYLVRLAEPAVATYQGDIKGFAATSARATGKKRLDTKSKAAKNYQKHLLTQQSKVLDTTSKKLGRTLDVKYKYQWATNGFAVVLTAAEAKAMRSMDGVVSVQRERMETLLTDAGPAWIGAPEIWNNKPAGSRGEGVVVAILDTGINSDHPSFADVGDDGYNHTNPLGSGNYLPGSYCDEDDASFCNDKLIGAWDMVASDGDIPEDNDGHGSHTASTVAGNVVYGAELVAPTTAASFDISGVAPHANIIAYDVCDDGCPGSALAAAIDQVLVDAGNLPNGIAALNYSISGGGNPYNDYVELGFLAAVDAGVYVAASAGNSGPAASTVAHLGPWVSTTAASTHNRAIVNQLIDITSGGGDIPDISGLGFTAGYGPATIINSADLEGTYPGATLCGIGPTGVGNTSPFPPGTFNGEIVACTRGTYGRVEKGENVLYAGAGGYVLMDNGAGLVGDAHALPAVHISAADGAALSAWLAANSGNNPQAVISGYFIDLDPANGDVMGGFSSRGPQLAFDVLKPDVTAPGVDIMGAEANGQGLGTPEYQILSGTSMSSPHNAGAGALMTAMRPDLTPPQIKSAIMLSSSTEFMVKEDGATPADPFDDGAGRIDLWAAKQADLVMDISTQEFIDADPATGGDPSALNLASMMNSNCVGSCSWTRTVTNSTKNTAHWNVTVSGEGFDAVVVVDPQSNSDDYNLKLKKGQSATITVTADTSLSDDGWHFGTVNLDRNLDKGPDLHMPVAVYASKASNPDTFTKTVDAATASPGDTLTYELVVTNSNLTGEITVTDMVPAGTTFVPSSETEVVTNGSTSSAWAYDGGSNSLSWTGELDVGGLQVSASPAPFGYFSLTNLGVAPFSLPGDCDDGAWTLNIPAFTFNGASYSQVIWSVNGTIEAGSASGSAAGGGNRNMPNATPPNNLIAPYWDDLDLCSAGNWYVANLSSGPYMWTVYEWENVPHFGDSTDRESFQIWVERDGSPTAPAIHFTYARLDRAAPSATVGAENSDASNGFSYYYNGTGTPPAVGVDLLVETLIGGTATLGFQVTTDSCDNVINEGEMSNAGNSERAIAVTTCP